ncbi:HupE/UreJ family protein [Altererythrobacter sp. Z27]|uniref:HupE/UreJ family protein n=1 Tax=Altererythrobacter sp. Z27 TaxID=3461147 RepID=UPI00404412CD
MRLWLAALLAALLLAVPALADELRPFSIEFSEREAGKWTIDWKQPLTSPDASQMAVPALPANCEYLADPVVRSAPMALIGHAEVACSDDVSGGTIGLPQLFGNSDALALVTPLGRPVQTLRLTAEKPLATISARPDRWAVAKDYFAIGTEHILMGWDHLLFVIALVLLVQGGWAVVKAATAFTIAHSLTLAAVTLGYAGLPQRPVEALIALSIMFLAVELARNHPESWTRRWPWIVAFGFGLLHGFGFAGALREIGLPEGEVPMALLTFNLGVEAGQLLVIAAVLALRAAVQRLVPKGEPPALKAATYGIGIIAAYWVVERVIA